MARRVSIHIGLNSVDPTHYDGWDGKLQACEADANDMHAIATRSATTTRPCSSRRTRPPTDQAGDRGGGRRPRRRRPAPAHILGPRRPGPGRERRRERRPQRRDVGRVRPPDHRRRALRAVGELQARRADLHAVRQLPQRHGEPRDRPASSGPGGRPRDCGEAEPAPAGHAARRADRDLRGAPGPVRRHREDRAAQDGRGRRRVRAAHLRLPGRPALERRVEQRALHGERARRVGRRTWDGGGYAAFRDAIVARMPEDQQPEYTPVGAKDAAFEQQRPFTDE